MLDDDCRKGRHTWLAWTTVLETVVDDIRVVTLMRRCALCPAVQDARRDTQEAA